MSAKGHFPNYQTKNNNPQSLNEKFPKMLRFIVVCSISWPFHLSYVLKRLFNSLAAERNYTTELCACNRILNTLRQALSHLVKQKDERKKEHKWKTNHHFMEKLIFSIIAIYTYLQPSGSECPQLIRKMCPKICIWREIHFRSFSIYLCNNLLLCYML